MSKVKEVYFHSVDKTEAESDDNGTFTVKLYQPLAPAPRRISLKSVLMKNLFSDIETYNNKFGIIIEDDTSTEIDLDIDLDVPYYFKDANNIETYFKDKIETAVAGSAGTFGSFTCTVSINENTNKMTISSSSNDLRFSSTFTASNGYFNYKLGYIAGENSTLASSQTFTKAVNINSQQVFLTGDIFNGQTTNTSTSSQLSNVIAQLPLNVARGAVIYYENPLENDFIELTSNIQLINFRLTNSRNKQKYYQGNISICCRLEYF